MDLPIKYEHTKFIHCDAIMNLRNELSNDRSNDNTHYCLVKRNQEKYIRELIRFLILKLYHKDYKTEELNNYEDIIVPFDNEVESLWILLISHTNDYKKFLASLSSYYSDKNTVFFERNFDRNLRTYIPEAANKIKNTKKSISKILYKNRYGSLPDFEIEDCFFDDQNNYWEGSCYPSGKWKTGILVYSKCYRYLNPDIKDDYFIGTLADDYYNNILTGQFYTTDGTVTEYVNGDIRGQNGDDESVDGDIRGQNGDDESVDDSVITEILTQTHL